MAIGAVTVLSKVIIQLLLRVILQRTTTSGVTKPQNQHQWIRWGRIAPLQANCSGLERGCARREPRFGAAPRFRENPRHHLFAQRPIFQIAKGGVLAKYTPRTTLKVHLAISA